MLNIQFLENHFLDCAVICTRFKLDKVIGHVKKLAYLNLYRKKVLDSFCHVVFPKMVAHAARTARTRVCAP